MDRRHVCLVALIVAPWLGIIGAALAACGLLLCGEPGRIAAGVAALATVAAASSFACKVLGAWRPPGAAARHQRPA